MFPAIVFCFLNFLIQWCNRIESISPLTILIHTVCFGWLELVVAVHQETKALLIMQRQRNISFSKLDHVILVIHCLIQTLFIFDYLYFLPDKYLLVCCFYYLMSAFIFYCCLKLKNPFAKKIGKKKRWTLLFLVILLESEVIDTNGYGSSVCDSNNWETKPREDCSYHENCSKNDALTNRGETFIFSSHFIQKANCILLTKYI